MEKITQQGALDFVLFILYCWVIKSWKMTRLGKVRRRGEMIISYKILVGKPEGKRPLKGHISRWEDNIRMNLKKHCVGLYGLNSSCSG
jgi:hypothetical protein